MKKFRTVMSIVVMILAGIIGLFVGAFINEGIGCAILFSMIAGIACIVYTLDNSEE